MNQKNIIQKVVVGGILIEKGKALILQRNKNEKIYPSMWELPSGKKEFLEKTEDALIREFQEEAGIQIGIVAPVSVFDYQTTKGDETRDSVQINFLVIPIGKIDVKISDEHQAYAWIEPKDIGTYDISDATKDVLGKAFRLYNLSIL